MKDEVEYFLLDKENIGIGDLVLIEVLLEYDWPRIFVCENKDNEIFLVYESVSEEIFESWTAIKISVKRYRELVHSEITLRDAYLNLEYGKYYIINRIYSDPFVHCNNTTTTAVDTTINETTTLEEGRITEYFTYIGGNGILCTLKG